MVHHRDPDEQLPTKSLVGTVELRYDPAPTIRLVMKDESLVDPIARGPGQLVDEDEVRHHIELRVVLLDDEDLVRHIEELSAIPGVEHCAVLLRRPLVEEWVVV